MDCQTCDELIAEYKDAVGLFKDAVHSGQVARPGEFVLATGRAARWGLICQDASDALREHWRKDHGSLAANADSR